MAKSHGYFAYESTLHVPVIIHWPQSSISEPQRVAEPAGLIDLAPTLLNYLHIPVPPSFVGVNLLEKSNSVEHPVYSETAYAHDAFNWAMLRRLRIAEKSYIDAPRPELYDLRVDPGEQINTARQHPEQLHSYKAQLTALMTRYSNAPSGPLVDDSASSQAALRSLGIWRVADVPATMLRVRIQKTGCRSIKPMKRVWPDSIAIMRPLLPSNFANC